MERERLTHLLKDPGQVAREDLADLRSLTERYPWFSGAQVLRVVGEKAAGEVRSDEALSMAAAHVPSRAVLFDMNAEPMEREARPLASKGSKGNEYAERTAALMHPVPVPVPVTVSTPEAEAHEALAEAVEAQPIIEAGSDTIDHSPAEEDPLERQILEAALASAYDLSLHAPPSPIDVEPEFKVETLRPTHLPVPAPEQSTSGEDELLRTPDPEASLPIHEASSAVKQQERSVRKRFSSWLADERVTGPAVSAPLTPERRAGRPATIPTRPGGPLSPEQALAPFDTASIVDRFISQENQLPVAKATFFTPQQAAKKSLDDTAGLVTETLARIYAKQGSTAKAIDAYRKLALKYPDKSTYFAALARSLEEQQNK